MGKWPIGGTVIESVVSDTRQRNQTFSVNNKNLWSYGGTCIIHDFYLFVVY